MGLFIKYITKARSIVKILIKFTIVKLFLLRGNSSLLTKRDFDLIRT